MDSMVQTILQSVFAVLGTIITGLLLFYVPKVVAIVAGLVERYLHIQLTEAQKDTVRGSVDTMAGQLVVGLSSGRIKIGDLRPESPVVMAAAVSAVNAVPDASAAMNVRDVDMARMAIGRVGKLIAADPTIPTLSPAIAIIETPGIVTPLPFSGDRRK